MAKLPSFARKTWLFTQQGGRCYLQIASACRRNGGAMHLEKGASNGRVQTNRLATWEHLFARNAQTPRGMHRHHVMLLACAECNHRKGDARIATQAQIEFAAILAKVWFLVASSNGTGIEAFAKVQIEFTLRDGAPVIALPLPVDLSLPVDFRIGRPHIGGEPTPWIKRDGVKVELPVPATVDEALAQVGVFVPSKQRRKLERAAKRAAEKHPRLPAAGYDPPRSQRTKLERAEALGVTDPRFLPKRTLDTYNDPVQPFYIDERGIRRWPPPQDNAEARAQANQQSQQAAARGIAERYKGRAR